MLHLNDPLTGVRYVDNYGSIAKSYPANPNGSPDGLAGMCSMDGRVTIIVPHQACLSGLSKFLAP